MKKLTLIVWGVVIFSIFPIKISFAQSPNMNGLLAKYWFYRWRLRNDFMVMGEGPGQSLVADTRNKFRGQYMLWGDVMIMHGYYLTMLAIEHKILADKGRYQDLQNNERELYYAIKAFERVDYVSETFYSSQGNNNDAYRVGDEPLPPDVNGYFFRDDVPPDFLNLDPDIDGNNVFTPNYYSLTNGKTGIDYGLLTYNQSDYAGLWGLENSTDGNSPPALSQPQHPIVNYKKGTEDVDASGVTPFGYGEESQDQVIRLLLGFYTIVRSIPDMNFAIDKDKDGVVDTYMNFNQEAKRHSTNIIGRMAGYFSGTTEVGINENQFHPYWTYLVTGGLSWLIMNPRQKQVSIGGFPMIYMIPMQQFSSGLYTSNNDLGIWNSMYAYSMINTIGTLTWASRLNGYNDWVNAKMALILNVMAHSGTGFAPVGRFVAEKSKAKHIDGFYVPLYDYFWNWDPEKYKDQELKQHGYNYANLLLTMAPCVGPHNFGYTNLPQIENNQYNPALGPFSNVQDPDGIPVYWNTPFLFDNRHDVWDDGIDMPLKIVEGWFSGVDFMLLHNLIYANTDGTKPLYHDLINRVVDYDVNLDDYTDRSKYSVQGLMLGAFENLRIQNNIHGNTPVTLKALDYILLENGVIDPQTNGAISIETGKITCGNIYTSQNTPYSRGECEECGLEGQLGSFIAPPATGKDASFAIDIPNIEDMESYARNSQYSMENEVRAYPNPTNSFFQ